MLEATNSHPALGLLLRLFWMFFGNVALVFTLAWIATRSRGVLTVADAAYAALAVLVVLARFVDVRFLAGDTAEGDRPATLADWQRHAAIVVACAAIAWVAVRALTGWF